MCCTSPFVVQTKDGVRREVPCGRCFSCRLQRSREWATRIVHEAAMWESAIFTTLTYDEGHLPRYGTLEKDALAKFFKRLRSRMGERKVRYYASAEYGEENGRPHYHAVIFGLQPCFCGENYKGVLLCNCPDRVMIKSCWPFGSVDRLGTVTYESARYTADYVGKQILADPEIWTGKGLQRPFQVMSKGLGRDFADANSERLKKVKGLTVRGAPVGLPRYYANRLGIKLNAAERMAVEQVPSRTRHEWIGQQRVDLEPLKAPRNQRALDELARARLTKKGHM